MVPNFIHTQHLPLQNTLTFHFNSFSSMLNTCLSSKHKWHGKERGDGKKMREEKNKSSKTYWNFNFDTKNFWKDNNKTNPMRSWKTTVNMPHWKKKVMAIWVKAQPPMYLFIVVRASTPFLWIFRPKPKYHLSFFWPTFSTHPFSLLLHPTFFLSHLFSLFFHHPIVQANCFSILLD